MYVAKRANSKGIPIKDADRPVILTVTKQDIVNAKKGDSKQCALVRASTRLPGVKAAYFFRTTGFLEYADRIVRYKLPHSVQKELVCFDRTAVFAHGAYQLSPPAPTDRATTRSKRKARRAVHAKVHAGRLATRPDVAANIDRVVAFDRRDLAKLDKFTKRVAEVLSRVPGDPTTRIVRSPEGASRLVVKAKGVRGLEDPGDD